MILDVVPYVRLGQFKIGTGKQEINQQLGDDSQDIAEDLSTQDTYPHVGLTFDYNEDGYCISIKATAPATAIFDGINLLETTFALIRERYPNYTRMGNDTILLTGVGIGLTLGNSDNYDRQIPYAVSIYTREFVDDLIRDLESWYRISC